MRLVYTVDGPTRDDIERGAITIAREFFGDDIDPLIIVYAIHDVEPFLVTGVGEIRMWRAEVTASLQLD